MRERVQRKVRNIWSCEVAIYLFIYLFTVLLSKAHYLLFSLCTAMFPRMLMTLDEDLKPLAVPVRVGEAVDVVGVAGKPKTITGFQTHTTPVLLGYRDRAELATDDCILFCKKIDVVGGR
jgi:26S proteasome non-ATPase regulatory subunit RPN1 C-terminal